MMELRKKRFILIICVVTFGLVMLGNQLVSGHSPASMSISYNYATEELSVNITHNVADLGTHYIELIEVWLNDISVENYTYTSQPDQSFTRIYTINATDGDTFKVKATCNQVGSDTKTLIVSQSATTSEIAVSYICITVAGLVIISRFTSKKIKR